METHLFLSQFFLFSSSEILDGQIRVKNKLRMHLTADLQKEQESVHDYEDRVIALEKEISSQHVSIKYVKTA